MNFRITSPEGRSFYSPKSDEKLPKKEEKGISWIFAIVFVCVGLLLWMGYFFCTSRLRFRRELGLNLEDFDYPVTNTYNTAKWWFIAFFPVVLGPFAFIFLILLIHYMYISETTTKDKFYFQTNLFTLILYMGILITAIIFSAIELGYANNPQHVLNVATDIRICCASDVVTPGVKLNGCPLINTCGIAPISTRQLNIDTYFLLTFIFNIGLLLVCVACIYLVFLLSK